MPEIEILHELTAMGSHFVLQHPYDLSGMDCENLETTYLDQASAESAATLALLSLLRAGKSIAFSFERAPDLGSGRETLWVCPSTDIRFRFNGSRPPRIDEQWVRAIIATAESPTGLRLIDEAEVMSASNLIKA
ncbi:hypothetical protein N1028_02070 [Herbiconiux sp. CPCC 203407]|uniref:DUF7882 domain-containing protein n=1 Tax=Herbiconiux oxytropis TaxID=2970915 RepID=A0AA41XGU8_9MICO|nr:hypothetical protein [Herbiconiux oxytropis]MCS5721024.1 hypothetical protein [Herbiconiux oxytropis]MCS5724676.1 hypothetical protein [Herbiconiux oxytropis]